jgi:hypothetical protein
MVSQAQRDELAAPIKEWLRNNPMAGGCNMLNGRRELIVHVKNFYAANFSKNLTDLQLKQKNNSLLNQHRPGIIRPECTRKDCKTKAVGALGACSKEESDKKNKKNNQVNNPFTTRLTTRLTTRYLHRGARTKMT